MKFNQRFMLQFFCADIMSIAGRMCLRRIRMSDEDKKLVREHAAGINFFKYSPPFTLSVLKYMHGGIYDDIKYINYKIMVTIYVYILTAAEAIRDLIVKEKP